MIPTGLNSHLFCLGVNHKHTPVDIRERVAFSEVEQTLAERELLEKGFTEAVILSTCNRVEIYACSDETSSLDHGKIQDWLHERFQLAHDEKEKLAFYDLRQDGVARHLFEVVSGLDSMVLGETEIFGQVKKSYAKALENGTTGRTLNKLFQQAFATENSFALTLVSSKELPPWAAWRWNWQRKFLVNSANVMSWFSEPERRVALQPKLSTVGEPKA